MQPPYQQPSYPPQNQYPYHQPPYQPYPLQNQSQPNKRTSHKGAVITLVVIGVLILVFAIAVLISGGGLAYIQHMQSSTCSVGIVGSNATITISGVGAETQCNQIVTDPNNKVSWYELQGVQPSGNVMCEGTIHGDTIIVRDQGIFNIYGNDICSNFLKSGMTPTS